ncbi:MAG: hypothetical protein WCO60_16950 [Verrucomicrobiota bacterium]
MNYTATLTVLVTCLALVDLSAQNYAPDYPANQSMSATLNGAQVRLLELCERNVIHTTTHKTTNLEHSISSTITNADIDYYDIFEVCYNDIKNDKVTWGFIAERLISNPNKFLILRCCPIKIEDLRITKLNKGAMRALSMRQASEGFLVEKYQQGMQGCDILNIRVAKCEREGGPDYPHKDKVEDAILRYIEYARSKKAPPKPKSRPFYH